MIKNKPKYRHQTVKDALDNKAPSISAIKNHSILHIVLVFCLVTLLYSPSVKFGLTGYDDDMIITNNIATLSNIGNFFKAFQTDAFIGRSLSFYRPLQTISFMLDIWLSGGNHPWMYHLSNILIFALVACLLYIFLRRFMVPPKLALFSTLIFCSHPLFISFVAWIPARGDLLLALFSLLSFLSFMEFLHKKQLVYLAVSWVFFSAAIFCKETAALLPFIFIIYYFIYFPRKHIEKKYLLSAILFGISGASWFILRFKAIGGISNHKDIVGLAPFLSNLKVIPESIAKLFLPYKIDPIPVFSIYRTTLGSILILIIIFIFFKDKIKPLKEKFFCFSWYLVIMLPAMLYKDNYSDYFNHRFFLPSIGMLLFLIFILPRKWYSKGDIKRSWLMIPVLIFFFSFTLVNSRIYYDSGAFYNSAISMNPNSAMAYNNRGFEKYNKNDFDGAFEDYNRAISICPTYFKAYYNRGILKKRLGDFPGAINDYSKAITLLPKYAEAYNNRGNVKFTSGDKNGAIDDFNKAIELKPGFTEAYINRGNVKLNSGNNIGAIEDYNLAIAINPLYAQAYYNIGVAKSDMGDNTGAIPAYMRAISLDPAFAQAYYSLGFAMYSTANFLEALNYYSKAIEINPKYVQAYENRAIIRYKLKDLTGALNDCEILLSLKPGDEKTLAFKTLIGRELMNQNH